MAQNSSHDPAILGIDIGTSGTKAAMCFVNQRGSHGFVSRVKQATNAPGNLQVTQSPAEWYEAAVQTCREVLAEVPSDTKLAAISVTGQMQDLIAVGNNPPELLRTDAILYSDARAQDASRQLSELCKKHIDATSILPKLALLPKPLEGLPPDYALLLGAADYVIYAFADASKPTVCDATTVSTTGLTKPPHRKYDTSLFRQAGLSSFLPLLPSVLETSGINARLSKIVADRLGRPDLVGTPLVHSGGDAFSATVGAGRDVKGSGSYIYCGTSGWIGGTLARGSSIEGSKDGLFALGHCADASAEIALASLSTAGGNVTFASETLLGGAGAAELNQLASTAPIGANGLVYMPYITGRRCPSPDAAASGALIGLRASTTRADVARAVIEGTAFAYAYASRTLPQELVRPNEALRMVGGGARSDTLVRGLAALVAGDGGIVTTNPDTEVGIVGAAKTAARAIGIDIGEDWWVDDVHTVVQGQERKEWLRAYGKWVETC